MISAGEHFTIRDTQTANISDLEITGVDKGTTTVVIPDGVTRVADQAFKLNEEITKVVFPDSLTSIGSEAFYMCSYISHFEFPKNLKRIEDGAFDYCRFLVNPIFPDSLEYIGEYAFISWKKSAGWRFAPVIYCRKSSFRTALLRSMQTLS